MSEYDDDIMMMLVLPVVQILIFVALEVAWKLY